MDPSVKWLSILEEFRVACQDIDPLDCVKAPWLSSLGSIIAIEIMDPRTDLGLLCPTRRKLTTFEEAVAHGIVRVDGFTSSEMVGIMDQTLVTLASWLDGKSLLTTILTNYYVKYPHHVTNPHLKTFVILVHGCVHLLRMISQQTRVSHEEEFSLSGTDLIDTRELTTETIQDLVMSAMNSKSGFTENERKVIETRIQFLGSYIDLLLVSGTGEIVRLKQVISACQKLSVEIQTTLSLGDGLNADMKSLDPYMIGFDPFLNFMQFPATFPKPSLSFSREEAIVYLQETIKRVDRVSSILDCLTFSELCSTCQELVLTSLCPLSRAVMKRLMFKFELDLGNFLRKDLQDLFCEKPSSIDRFISNGPELASEFNALLSKAEMIFGDMLVLFCLNPARRRGRMVYLIQDLGFLIKLADFLLYSVSTSKMKPGMSEFLRSVNSWLTFYTVDSMLSFLQLGFGLSLYGIHELPYVFWYIDYLVYWKLALLNRTNAFTQSLSSVSSDTMSQRKGKKKQAASPRPSPELLVQLSRIHTQYIGIKALFRGYILLAEAFKQSGRLKAPSSDIGLEKLRYNHRFKPFLHTSTPNYIPYETFGDGIKQVSSLQSVNLFSEAQHKFAFALSKFQASNLDERLLQVAKGNMISAGVCSLGARASAKEPLKLDMSSHPYYPVLKP